MGVKFTAQAEKERIANNQARREIPKWELLETDNIVEALHFAKDAGWKEDKVQVRYVRNGDITTYFVEPYEKGCGCRGILKYKEFFN